MMRKTRYNLIVITHRIVTKISPEKDNALGRSKSLDYFPQKPQYERKERGKRFQAVLFLVAHMCEP